MRRILAGLALALLIASPVAAARPVPTGSIDLNGTATYQSVVTFTITVSPNLDCTRGGCARVLVECYQSGDLVYGEGGDIGQARGDGTSPLGYVGFLLGGGGSVWVYQHPNTPADCTATLFYFDNGGPVQTFNVIATTAFTAVG